MHIFLFLLVAGAASVIDIKYHIVPWYILIAMFVVGLTNVNQNSFIGFALGFIPFLLVGLFSKLGGGDVKYVAVCGFVLKGTSILPATLIGLAAALIIMPIILKIKHKSIKGTAFALVPFLSLGSIVILLIS